MQQPKQADFRKPEFCRLEKGAESVKTNFESSHFKLPAFNVVSCYNLQQETRYKVFVGTVWLRTLIGVVDSVKTNQLFYFIITQVVRL